MLMMQDPRILVPLDGSTLAERALHFLPQVAVGPLRLRLIAVVYGADGVDPFAADDQLVCDADLALAYLDAARERLSRRGISHGVEVVVRDGDPVALLLAEAEDWRADLVLVSTHGRSGMRRWRLGSVADKLIRGAVCKTAVIGPLAEPSDSLRSLMVPLDGSLLAEQALPEALSLAAAAGAALHLVRTVPDVEHPRSRRGHDDAAGYLDEVAARLGAPTPVHTALLRGPTADELLRYAQQESIDLTLMTSHGRRGFMRSALGSVTDRMLAEATSPVMVVPVAADF
jgi:nucleotide-binding universal stress UspA family protein